MSGIVGIVNLDGAPVERDLLGRMTAFMSFRGPDAQETWSDGNVGFGHTMLRTTFEAETEQQPLTLDGKVWLTADARIDGRAQLIAELEGKLRRRLRDSVPSNGHGSDVRVPNDAELILYSYEAWGEDCVKHLIGDFAFAIWDSRARRLFCARDHFGVKPFYYAQISNAFIFSNTLNCVRLYPGLSNKLNDQAVGDFLMTASNQDLTSTIFYDIQRLAPATSLRLAAGLQQESFGVFDGKVRHRSASDCVNEFQELFKVAVADRMRSAKIGISMSGGLDSASVAATARRERPGDDAGSDIQAFTMVYDWLIRDDERRWSGLVAERLRIPINHVPVDNYSLYERWDQPALFYPEPMYFPLSAISFDFFTKVANHSRVMLSGDGGDLALLSSGEYLSRQLRSLRLWHVAKAFVRHVVTYHRVPAFGFRTVFLKRRIDPVIQPNYPSWLAPDFRQRLQGKRRPEPKVQINSCHNTRPEASRLLATSAWPNTFEQEDPGFTGVTVEKRNPFFDLRLMKFLFSIPSIPWFVDKEMLRVSMAGVLPEETCRRPKTPLQQSALSLLWRKGWRQQFQPMAALSEYVDVDKFLNASSEVDIDQRWQDYLPIGLNYWLRNLGSAKHNIKKENN